MRYFKIASAKNPDIDFIELNDLHGFFCTSFQTLGISRRLEFLSINNRQFDVENKPEFKRYSMTIEILTKYAEYEREYRKLIDFLDRNKKSGLRVYYRPYDTEDIHYCLFTIEGSAKTAKLQPVILTLIQNSLWFGTEKKSSTAAEEQEGNIFAFSEDSEMSGYYCAGFKSDANILDYYCISFFNGATTTATIINDSYNEIPLNIVIQAPFVNPTVRLYKAGEATPIRQLQILATNGIGSIEINSHIKENGVWYKNGDVIIDYTEYVNNEMGSPYFYIGHGTYMVVVTDDANNVCYCDIFYQEEYSE